jgi:hypothetical protein
MQNCRRIHELDILEEAPNLFDVCTIFVLPLELQTRLVEHLFILVRWCRGAESRKRDGNDALLQGQAASLFLGCDIILLFFVQFRFPYFLLFWRFAVLSTDFVAHRG